MHWFSFFSAQPSFVRVGDIVLFRCAGAYGWDISHHDFLT
ncbi:hypothetical protein BRO54_2467 [Geobacillus proteiniphilus]|uniref:Diaminopimelate decarboxylase n=1 Tax=Geobacillus proteiniphilus TaxID=860353 RepID=A0A1Q5SW15_9BACL|nr:hypothetical protein BRO54_2467 [Geobacillus proteiniphilus]